MERNNNKPYFESEERRLKLENELVSWIGTCFLYNPKAKAKKRVAADCVTFALGVYTNFGLVPSEFTIPYYKSVKGGHNDLKKLYEKLKTINGLTLVWDRDDCPISTFALIPGDVLVCSTGNAVHHLMIYESSDVWHCWPSYGVSRIPFQTSLIHKTAQRVYRFYEQ